MPVQSIRELFAPPEAQTLPLWLVAENQLGAWRAQQSAQVAAWVNACGFRAERHRVLALPGPAGMLSGAVLGLGHLDGPEELTLWHTAGLAERLPVADFQLVEPLPAMAARQVMLGFAYGHYRFQRYRSGASPLGSAGESRRGARLLPPAGGDFELDYIERTAGALAWARDLINTPAGDMGPAELAAEACVMAKRLDAQCRVVEGARLLEEGYPAIHAVGRASAQAPRLIDIRWGEEGRPRLTLVGKGVCFDTGGLDLKTSQAMSLMKKDMGGAACTLALARMVVEANLPVRLRVLIPAVENSVSGDAYRPGDVLRTRKGLTVEVGNTDAEGRLVLCDALAEADREQPALLVDLATLTGAARIALGPELPALYGNDSEWVESLLAHARAQHDPMWPMPLWPPYEEDLASKLADTSNIANNSFAGSILAALFLRRFVAESTPWLHIDLFGWNVKDRPGRPVGAEAQGVRALFALFEEKFTRA